MGTGCFSGVWKSRLSPFFLLALLSCTPKPASQTSPSAEPERATIFVSADLRGYLNPCGCSENMRGGIARSAWQLAEARKGGVPLLYVEGGNTLFGTTGIPPSRVAQDEARAQTLARALKAMEVATHAVGALDRVRGESFREALSLPDQLPGTARIFEVGKVRVGVVTGQTADELRQAVGGVSEAQLILALVDHPLGKAQRELAGLSDVLDLVVATRSEGEFGAEENRLVRGALPFVQLQSKGRSLLRIDVALTGRGGLKLVAGAADQERTLAALNERIALLDADVNRPDISSELKRLKQEKVAELVARRQALASTPPPVPDHDAFHLRFVPLEATLPSAPSVAAIVADYDRAVGDLNLVWAREHGADCPPPPAGRAAFVGNALCRDCHADAFAVYEKSKHAHAWETLEAAGKQFHLDCVGCHVTGADQPGGVCRLDQVKGREDVGCESCHGAGSLHVDAPSAENILPAPKEAQCVGCHNPENSPHFDFVRYLPRILGPGHGG